ncbi:MAG: DUF5806 family protein [Methanosarcinales archaeon Met12]|nr:MAG: DUF5806 family protein [Methanosarcinales archaeon Met12]
MAKKYQKFKMLDKQQYAEVTRFLKERTHLTAREWAIARLCADFRTTTNRAEMTWIGENLPDLVPFMNESYSRQAVAAAHSTFKDKVLRSGTTFFYAYYSGLISMEDMVDMVHQIAENIEHLLQVGEGKISEDGVDVDVQLRVAEVLRQITHNLQKGVSTS